MKENYKLKQNVKLLTKHLIKILFIKYIPLILILKLPSKIVKKINNIKKTK